MGGGSKGRGGGGKGKKGKKGKKAAVRWGDEDRDDTFFGASIAPGRQDQEQEQDQYEGQGQGQGQGRKRVRRYTQEDQDKERRLETRRRLREREAQFARVMSVPNRPSEIQQRKPPGKKRVRSKLMLSKGDSRPARALENGRRQEGEDNGAVYASEPEVEVEGAGYDELFPLLGEAGLSKEAASALELRRLEEQGLDAIASGSEEGSEVTGDEETSDEEDGGDFDGDDGRQASDIGAGEGEEEEEGEGEEEDEDGKESKLELEELSSEDESENEIAQSNAHDPYSERFNAAPLSASDAEALSNTRPVFRRLDKSSGTVKEWESLDLVPSYSSCEGLAAAPPSPFPKSGAVAISALTTRAGLRPKLATNFVSEGCKSRETGGGGGRISKLQSMLLPSLLHYQDVVYCAKRHFEAQELRRSYLLHALNHILKARTRVLRHNKRLRKEAAAEAHEKAAEAQKHPNETPKQRRRREKRELVTARAASSEEPSEVDGAGRRLQGNAARVDVDAHGESDEWRRDQGFARPTVLIVCPFRHFAYDLVMDMLSILGPDTAVSGRKRFREDFGPDETEGKEPPEDATAKQKRDWMITKQKPSDWHAMLGPGLNCDDDFKLGLAFTPGGGKKGGRGVGVRLYSDFYRSDLVIASPLGLELAKAERGQDFLCGVEICVLDSADVLLHGQNWEHVASLLSSINNMPSEDHGIDFSRVRESATHGQAGLLRQTVVLSALSDPQVNSLFATHCHNPLGALKVVRRWKLGTICSVDVRAELVFQRFKCSGVRTAADERFEYFKSRILDPLLAAKQNHTAIFVPSYFDFVRVRNELLRRQSGGGSAGEEAVFVSEYSRVSETARGRARFFHGKRSPLVYTGRAHFFNRLRIRGMRHLIFYAPPDYPEFFPELVNLLEEETSVPPTCLVLFSQLDCMPLRAIVGDGKAKEMVGGGGGGGGGASAAAATFVLA